MARHHRSADDVSDRVTVVDRLFDAAATDEGQ